MKVFIDLISGDEMVSDSYPHTEVYNGAGLEVKARYRTKGSDFIAIASDDVNDDEAPGETVVDIVDAFKLNETNFDKKGFMAWCKAYMAKLVTVLEANGKADRVPEFKKGATEMVKFIVSKFDEFQFYAGSKFDMEAGLAFSYQKEQTDEGPTFLFFADGLREEKF